MSDTFDTITRILILIRSIRLSCPDAIKRLQKQIEVLRTEFESLLLPIEVERIKFALFIWILTFCDIRLWLRNCIKQIPIRSRPPPRRRRRSCCSVKDPRPQPSIISEYLSRFPVSVCGSARSYKSRNQF